MRRVHPDAAIQDERAVNLISTQVHAHVVQQLVHVQVIALVSRLVHEVLVRRRRRLELEHFRFGDLLVGPSHLVQDILVDT